MLAVINKNKNFNVAEPSTPAVYSIFSYLALQLNAFLKAIIKIKLLSQTNGIKYIKNGVNGPKIIPLDKTPKLGKIAKGK